MYAVGNILGIRVHIVFMRSLYWNRGFLHFMCKSICTYHFLVPSAHPYCMNGFFLSYSCVFPTIIVHATGTDLDENFCVMHTHTHTVCESK